MSPKNDCDARGRNQAEKLFRVHFRDESRAKIRGNSEQFGTIHIYLHGRQEFELNAELCFTICLELVPGRFSALNKSSQVECITHVTLFGDESSQVKSSVSRI
jgi:hypothetical protein